MVEAAIVMSLLIMLMLGVMEFGYALWQWNTMALAVQQAGRYVMVNNSTCDAACAQQQMQSVLTTASTSCPPATGAMCVAATSAAGSTGVPATMTLTATYSLGFTPLTGAITLRSQAKVPLD